MFRLGSPLDMLSIVDPPNDIHVEVLETEAEFEALERQWEELQCTAKIGSVFSSFDWQFLWWRSYECGQSLRLLVATEDNRVVGVLPLYILSVSMLRYPVKQLRFVGTGGDTFPDDLGPILASGREECVAAALAKRALEIKGWDVLLLTDMNPNCAFTRAIRTQVRRASLRFECGRSERIACINLPKTWEGWLQSLHRNRRWRIKNSRKKLGAAHKTKFFVWNNAETLDDAVSELIGLHRKRWENAGRKHGFSTPEYVTFHRAIMSACLLRDRLRLYCLEADDKIIAMNYFYRFRDRVYLMQSGFDPEFSKHRPGQVLLGYIVEHAIEEGNEVLDFLKGDHRYKNEIANAERETAYLTAYRPNFGAWVYELRLQSLPALKATLKRLMGRVRSTLDRKGPTKLTNEVSVKSAHATNCCNRQQSKAKVGSDGL